MDMKINASELIRLRTAKAWSQQHLADVSSLSLRTIQRAEKSGNASPETIKSLASALEVNLEILLHQKQKPNAKVWKLGATISALTALVASLLFISPVITANEIEINAASS